jgi:hypothetical protein
MRISKPSPKHFATMIEQLTRLALPGRDYVTLLIISTLVMRNIVVGFYQMSYPRAVISGAIVVFGYLSLVSLYCVVACLYQELATVLLSVVEDAVHIAVLVTLIGLRTVRAFVPAVRAIVSKLSPRVRSSLPEWQHDRWVMDERPDCLAPLSCLDLVSSHPATEVVTRPG